MKRWLIWLGIGIGLFVVVALIAPHTPVPCHGSTTKCALEAARYDADHDYANNALGALVAVALVGWFGITLFAVPLSIIRWLVKGRQKPSLQLR